ncbi:MAG: pyruvate kinase, partial [Bacteroidota bacterium]
MKIKKQRVVKIIEQLDAIIAKMEVDEAQLQEILQAVDDKYAKSAQNLVNYVSFRSFDVRVMQKYLKNLGLTRFVNAQSHIKASVLTIRYLLGLVVEERTKDALAKQWSVKEGQKQLRINTKNLLGKTNSERRVRIMVTQPTEAAENYDLVKQAVEKGMDIARINCAHDSPEVWSKMIANIKKAAAELNKTVKIAMDLAGPKIRTGEIVPGPRVLKCKSQKDALGKVVALGHVIMVSEADYAATPNTLPIASGDLSQLAVGDVLKLADARGRKRKLKVTTCENGRVIAETEKTIYFQSEMVLRRKADVSLELVVGDLPPLANAITLKTGDKIWIRKEQALGSPAEFDEDGGLIQPAIISCQMPEVFDYIKAGDRVFFDDGKIGGFITDVDEGVFEV